MSVVTKLVRVVTYREELPNMKSRDLLIAYSCDFDFPCYNLYILNAKVLSPHGRFA